MTPVDQFIEDTYKLYKVKSVLTAEKRRKLRYKLAMAEITDVVAPEDTPLATDIVLEENKKSASTLKTASGRPSLQAHSLRNAGMCPRCNSSMVFAQVSDSLESRFCTSCNVCIPVT
tara:strand:- start:129423 stop:129773 length:351 start_codon:yes stop_codon:yes gene_type:complete